METVVVASPPVGMINSSVDELGTTNPNMMNFKSPKTIPMLAPKVILVFQCFILSFIFI